MKVDRVYGDTAVAEVRCSECDWPPTGYLDSESAAAGQRQAAKAHASDSGHRVVVYTERAEYYSRVER